MTSCDHESNGPHLGYTYKLIKSCGVALSFQGILLTTSTTLQTWFHQGQNSQDATFTCRMNGWWVMHADLSRCAYIPTWTDGDESCWCVKQYYSAQPNLSQQKTNKNTRHYKVSFTSVWIQWQSLTCKVDSYICAERKLDDLSIHPNPCKKALVFPRHAMQHSKIISCRCCRTQAMDHL